MGSRIRENPEKIFDCFVEVVIPQVPDQGPWVLQKYPDDFNDEEVLKSVAHFCYPCDIKSTIVQVFSFVLTGADSKWTFGYCRHTPNAPTAICLLSSLPWHETFYELLNRIAEITHRKETSDLIRFLENLYTAQVPDPGGSLILPGEDGKKVVKFLCSDHTKLPSIPENRNVSEYFNAVDAQTMMVLFASVLNERRIMITSKKLSRLSACVQSANALIYPMHWQHIFIPVLPTKLIDYLSAPMPFLIGVPTVVLEKTIKLDLSDVVVLHADQNKIETPFDDLQNLPPEIVSSLKRRLKNSNAMLGDRMARAFLHSLVQLIGGYRDALKFHLGEQITFDENAFIQSRTPSMQPFLQRMLHLQIFQQFIEERLEMLNTGKGFCDEFEREVNIYADKNSTKLKHQYKEWMVNMRKEGGAFLKSMKNKLPIEQANPAVKHAYKSVKDRSKKAYKEVRSKIQDLQQKEASETSISPGLLKARQPRSAPSSPTLLRTRPVTFHGIKPVNVKKSSKPIKLPQSSAGDSSPLTLRNPQICMSPFSWDKLPNPKDKPRQYNLLEVTETSDEISQEDTDGIRSQGNSPSLDIRRISMDLMGDLQDLIFRRCSVSDSSTDHSSKAAAMATSDYSVRGFTPSPLPSSPNPSPRVQGGSGEGLNPIPPPRTKRRGHTSSPRKVTTSQTGPTPDSTSLPPPDHEDLLIQLDEDETNSEEMFDPLLSKESKSIPNTSPQMEPRSQRSSSLPLVVPLNQPGMYQQMAIPQPTMSFQSPAHSPALFVPNVGLQQTFLQQQQQQQFFPQTSGYVNLQPTNPFQQPYINTSLPSTQLQMQRFQTSNPFASAGNTQSIPFNAPQQCSLPVHPTSGNFQPVISSTPQFQQISNTNLPIDPFAPAPSPPTLLPWDVPSGKKATTQPAGWETFN